MKSALEIEFQLIWHLSGTAKGSASTKTPMRVPWKMGKDSVNAEPLWPLDLEGGRPSSCDQEAWQSADQLCSFVVKTSTPDDANKMNG